MEVRLEPVGRPGGPGRLGGRLAALVPVAALAAVVVVALTARPPQPGVAPLGSLAVAAPIQSAAGSPGLAQGASSAPTAVVDRSVPVYAWGLAVRSLPAMLAGRAEGSVRGELVAVAGFMAHDPRTASCPDPDPGLPAVFCDRTGVLVAAPLGTDGIARSGPGTCRGAVELVRPPSEPRLDAQIPAGIPMPAMFAADPPPGAPGWAPLSVVIGRFASPTPPTSDDPARCGDAFVLERLAWAAGSWIDRILVRDPALTEAVVPSGGGRSLRIATREADRMEQILSIAVVQPAGLASLDPAVGQAAASGAASNALPAGPLWYLRSAGRQLPGFGRPLTWAVIDHHSGFVLATGAIGPD